jgi:hypothetical protein
MKIIGAGLAGLIAAHAFPQSRVFERSGGPVESHRALLRFRTDAVSKLTGIPFRKVTVRKGLFSNGRFVKPTIALANWYSEKCLGVMENERSIWNLNPVDRFIAPDDFYLQLIANVGDRITFDYEHDYAANEPVVSTAPLPIVLSALGMPSRVALEREPILVERYHVPDCDVYQTVYFPDPSTSIYRMSITGNVLIVEHAGDDKYGDLDYLVEHAFGIRFPGQLRPLGEVSQRYGKIATINNDVRKSLLFKLTSEHNIYSLGRFATWRNVLLCDLINDIDVIRRMMRTPVYDQKLATLER